MHPPFSFIILKMQNSETFISVDVEASGPIPGEYSMLSLGACVVGATDKIFYVELKPITHNFQPEAMSVCGLDLDELEKTGTLPEHAMSQFDLWLAQVTPDGEDPIFVAYPLAFDWMFVAYYFHRYLKYNPFGYSGLDVKSFYVGLTGADWSRVYQNAMGADMLEELDLTHHAREDAMAQAKLFARLLDENRRRIK